MNCMNCKAVVDTGMETCPNCGFNLGVQRKCFSLSNMYYNLGLDKAQIRDLSGAIDMLRRSLKFNKYNIQARNLLGLIYFETGEAVAALSEWIISKNIMPENNIATEYISRVQAEPAKLDMINQTIKKYNSALRCCRENNEDVAVIQLKKILSQNPKLIKGYHLLALIYIRKEEYEKARKILKKAARIDKTNSTTLRFLREVDQQTGTQTSLEPRRFGRREKEERGRDETETAIAYDTVIQPPTFRESSVAATMLNIALGLILGALVVWFLIGPASAQRINREADEKIVEYSGKMASQEAEIKELESQVEELNETTASAQQQISDAATTAKSYENLVKAVGAYENGNTANAINALSEVNSELLSVDARAVYDRIYRNLQDAMFRELSEAGQEAFDNANYTEAIDKLTKAREINDNDYTVLNVLAHSYRLSGDIDKAIAVFQEIIDKFPGTKKATRAKQSIEDLGGTVADDSNIPPEDDEEDPGTGEGTGDEDPSGDENAPEEDDPDAQGGEEE
ncbi:MAG: tetratricopeptide repeat protein [Fusicatenibacter sp.]